MNKQELIELMARRSNLSKATCKKALEAFMAEIESALDMGWKVSLVGFGTFGVKERKARTGKHPQTGEPIEIPAKLAPFFKPGLYLKEAAR